MASALRSTIAPVARALSSAAQSTPVRRQILFLGAPGVGKGTYASRIAPLLNAVTIATGDLVRDEIKAETRLGNKIKEFNDKGQLVPDDIIMEMVLERLSKPDASEGFILDGFPRNVAQAATLDQHFEINHVVDLTLPKRILVTKLLGRRLCSSCGTGYNVAAIHEGDYDMPPLLPKQEGTCDTCGAKDSLIQRADDNEQVIQNRLDVYETHTKPLSEYYASRGVLQAFEVKKGLADLDRLVADILEFERHHCT